MNSHNIENEEILAKNEGSVSLKMVIPSSSDFFDGHFPEFKLFPAVAQVEIVTRFANKYFGTKRSVSKIKRFKFTSPLLPDSTVQLDLSFKREKNLVSFTIFEFGKPENLYSTGTYSPSL